MKKWLSLIMVLAMLVCMTACGTKPDASNSGNQTTTTTNPSSSLSEYFTSVLENKQPFVYDGEEVTLSHLLSHYETDINRYALVDMDGDKQTEMAVDFDGGQFVLVLHKDSAVCYGYLFSFRSMYRIDTDGSCYWNNSASEYGCSRIQFQGESYEWTDLWHVERSDDGSDRYYIEDNAVSKEDFVAATSEEKEEVEWIEWDAGE